jgi:hypothetical protein
MTLNLRLGHAAFFLETGSSMIPMMSDSFMIRSSSPSILTSVPDHLPNSTRIAFFDINRNELAGLIAAAWANGDDLALRRLFLGGIRDDDAVSGFLLGLDARDDDAVVKWTKLHGVLPNN